MSRIERTVAYTLIQSHRADSLLKCIRYVMRQTPRWREQIGLPLSVWNVYHGATVRSAQRTFRG